MCGGAFDGNLAFGARESKNELVGCVVDVYLVSCLF